MSTVERQVNIPCLSNLGLVAPDETALVEGVTGSLGFIDGLGRSREELEFSPRAALSKDRTAGDGFSLLLGREGFRN